jgi:glycosyltransferase involved in cell wall biosynthesis
MTILMTVDTAGSVWTYAVDLARALGPRGISVVLASMGPPPRAWQRGEIAGIPTVQLVEGSYRLDATAESQSDVDAAGEWLLQLEQQFRPDVVHLNGYAHGAAPFTAPVIIVAHSCVYSWWWAVKRTAPPARWTRYHDEVVRGLDGARMVVAPTHAMAAAIERHYQPATRLRVIPNGREAASFAAARLAIVKTPLVLSVGRCWDEAKNLTALAAVAPRIAWPIYVAGRTDDRVPEGAMVSLGPLSPRRLISWYARASIYALPTRYEPFGLTPLEAALSGCALVLGDVPSLREVWGTAATFVPPDDESRLAAVLTTLIDDTGRRTSMARAALDRASCYTLTAAADRYASTYRELSSAQPLTGTHACAS